MNRRGGAGMGNKQTVEQEAGVQREAEQATAQEEGMAAEQETEQEMDQAGNKDRRLSEQWNRR
jgi:hypothetical protein